MANHAGLSIKIMNTYFKYFTMISCVNNWTKPGPDRMDEASEDDVDGKQRAFFSAQYVLKRRLFCYIWKSREAKLMQDPGNGVMYTKKLCLNHYRNKDI